MLMKINITNPLPSVGEILIFYIVKDKYFSPPSRTASRCPFSFTRSEPPDLCECKQKVTSDTLDREGRNNYLLLCKR